MVVISFSRSAQDPPPISRRIAVGTRRCQADEAVISLTQHVHAGSRLHLLGSSPEPELLRALSAERRVGLTTPPAFIWTSKTDEFVEYENSELYAAALRAHGIDHEYRLFPEGHHGRGLARAERYTREWPELCLQWLSRHGFSP